MSTERLRRLGPYLKLQTGVKFFIRLNPHYQSVGTNLGEWVIERSDEELRETDSTEPLFFRQSRLPVRR